MTAAREPRIRFPEAGDPGGSELRLGLEDGRALVGTSVAALATAFAVEGMATAVDMGRCSPVLAVQDTVLLTHCHSDHVAGLIAWLSAHTRRHRGAPARIALPVERRTPLLEALERWPDLDGVRRRVDLREVLEGVAPGDAVDLGDGAVAVAFAVEHNTAAVGWTLRAAGGRRPALAFAGDGTTEPFRRDPGLLDADTAVVDCSFVAPGTRVAARLSAHGHLRDWLELLPVLPCRRLVLAHLPPEASAPAVLEALGELPPTAPEIVPWCAGLGI